MRTQRALGQIAANHDTETCAILQLNRGLQHAWRAQSQAQDGQLGCGASGHKHNDVSSSLKDWISMSSWSSYSKGSSVRKKTGRCRRAPVGRTFFILLRSSHTLQVSE